MASQSDWHSSSSSLDDHPPMHVRSAPRPTRRRRAREVVSIWTKALGCLWKRVVHDNLDILAGGVALFAILSFMPAIAATVAIYGLMADPADIHAQVAPLAGVIPGDVMAVVTSQMTRAAAR